MPILNYTTKIESTKTIGEIQEILVRQGARKIEMVTKKPELLLGDGK